MKDATKPLSMKDALAIYDKTHDGMTGATENDRHIAALYAVLLAAAPLAPVRATTLENEVASAASTPLETTADAERLDRIIEWHSGMFNAENRDSIKLDAANHAALSDEEGTAVAITATDFWWLVDRARGNAGEVPAASATENVQEPPPRRLDVPMREETEGFVRLIVESFRDAQNPSVNIAVEEIMMTLYAALSASREDTARLDWIDETGASVVPAWSGEGARIGCVAQDGRRGGRTERRKNVRAAIDAARKQIGTSETSERGPNV
jgi:hypothetical protein